MNKVNINPENVYTTIDKTTLHFFACYLNNAVFAVLVFQNLLLYKCPGTAKTTQKYFLLRAELKNYE